jgi:hypothetical protein
LVGVASLDEERELRAWNAVALSGGLPFLPVLRSDQLAVVGPLCLPGRTACYECANVAGLVTVWRPSIDRVDARKSTDADVAISVVRLVASFVLERDGSSPRTILIVRADGIVDRRLAFRRPRCAACSSVRVSSERSPWTDS